MRKQSESDDPSFARVHQLQGMLLPQSPRQVCEQLGVNWWAATQLHLAGLLSFNPETVDALDERQEVELRFVGALVAAGCDNAMLSRLLANLEKPYCYRPDRVYYDWASQSWRLMPEPPQDLGPEEALSNWILSLEEEADVTTLQAIRDSAAQAISRLRSRTSS